mmetsp:Transcript_51288/g.75032  ORF Transcript_51288/g.75032 Transcript_51288/m.75032 type:complete len:265 (+) Transcript_51288:38-832(+)
MIKKRKVGYACWLLWTVIIMAMAQIQGWNIVFLHGLESGIHGSKARHLVESFPGACTVPDLEMSLLNWRKRNSAIRNFGNLDRSMDGCVTVAADECNRVNQENGSSKLLVIGSSWGGAVALKCVERGLIKPDKMLLLAPALSATGWLGSWLWPSWEVDSTCFNYLNGTERDYVPGSGDDKGLFLKKPIVVLHGTNDDTVPISSSESFSAQNPNFVEFHAIEGADHRMNGALGIASRSLKSSEGQEAKLWIPLKDIIEQMLSNCS